MPIYEYRRPDGTTFEIQQSFAEEALKVDPETGCRSSACCMRPAVHFKGKGFYNTDYGTRNRQRETAAAARAPPRTPLERSSVKGLLGRGSPEATREAGDSCRRQDAQARLLGAGQKDTKPVPAKS